MRCNLNRQEFLKNLFLWFNKAIMFIKKIFFFTAISLMLFFSACINPFYPFTTRDNGDNSSDNNGDSSSEYTVSFNSMGGTVVNNQVITEGMTASVPADPKKGYVFEGWYADSAFASVYNFDTPVAADITLYAKWGAYDSSFNIGDTGPGGGIIFYRAAEGFDFFYADNKSDSEKAYYLEAAPQHVGQHRLASIPFQSVQDYGTGDYFDYENNSDGLWNEIGTGRRNTAVILEVDTEAPAPKASVEYKNNEKNDWFLPSREELIKLYESGIGAAVGGFINERYWSSSQRTRVIGFCKNMVTGNEQNNTNKGNTFYVHPVRAF